MACEPFLKSILTGIWWDNDLSYVALRKLQIYDTIALRKARILVAWQNPETFTRQELQLASPCSGKSRTRSKFHIDDHAHKKDTNASTQRVQPTRETEILSLLRFQVFVIELSLVNQACTSYLMCWWRVKRLINWQESKRKPLKVLYR